MTDERVPAPNGLENMTEAEIDAELIKHGVNPKELESKLFQKCFVLIGQQAERIAALEATTAGLTAQGAALSQPVSDEEHLEYPDEESDLYEREEINALIAVRTAPKEDSE